MLNKPLQPLMVQAGEVVPEIQVEHPVHPSHLDCGTERIQRVMRGAPRPEPVREPEKVRLMDRIQYLHHRPLEEFVLKRGDPERPSRPSGFGMYALRDGFARYAPLWTRA